MKRVLYLCGVIALSWALIGCASLFFKPGFASDDRACFAEPPVVVQRGEQYFLRWHYGEMGFGFIPSYEVREGALWFSLQGTSGSGQVGGREVEMRLRGRAKMAALRTGGAFWWEPDGSLTPLEVIVEPAEWPLPVDPEGNVP